MTSRDEARRLLERRELAEGVAPPGLAAEQERTGQRREALAALAGVLAAVHGIATSGDDLRDSFFYVWEWSHDPWKAWAADMRRHGTITRFEARP